MLCTFDMRCALFNMHNALSLFSRPSHRQLMIMGRLHESIVIGCTCQPQPWCHRLGYMQAAADKEGVMSQ